MSTFQFVFKNLMGWIERGKKHHLKKIERLGGIWRKKIWRLPSHNCRKACITMFYNS